MRSVPLGRLIAAFAAVAISHGAVFAAASPLGLWYAEGGAARVEVARCGEELCGTVVWLRNPYDEHGCPMTDAYNPEAALRDRDVAGLTILRGFAARPDADGVWRDGSIYDPGSGRLYDANLWMEDEGRLRVRGYIAFSLFGRTTTWIRVADRAEVCSDAREGRGRSADR